MEEKKSNSLKKITSPSVISLQQGKIPPQALELEEAVLGAMLIDKKGVDEVIDILQPEAFYKTSHQYIFNSINLEALKDMNILEDLAFAS